jgi:predicted glycosyltransferase
MAGYNTMCETLALGTPALVVPRTTPRLEQALRARAFEGHGLARVLPPDQLTPEDLRRALQEVLAMPRVRAAATLPPGVDFSGLRRITRRVRKHLGLTGAV